jgi:hypothetical protein
MERPVHEELGIVAKIAAMIAEHAPTSIVDLTTREDLAFIWESEKVRWKSQRGANGSGLMAYAVIRGDRATGYLSVLFALENGAAAPRHLHHSGEFIMVFLGSLMDMGGDRQAAVVGPSEAIVHGWASEHAPATPIGMSGGGLLAAAAEQRFDRTVGEVLDRSDPAEVLV